MRSHWILQRRISGAHRRLLSSQGSLQIKKISKFPVITEEDMGAITRLEVFINKHKAYRAIYKCYNLVPIAWDGFGISDDAYLYIIYQPVVYISRESSAMSFDGCLFSTAGSWPARRRILALLSKLPSLRLSVLTITNECGLIKMSQTMSLSFSQSLMNECLVSVLTPCYMEFSSWLNWTAPSKLK